VSSRRDFLRSLLARTGARLPLPATEGVADAPHERPLETVEATPERVRRAFACPADQHDIAMTLARRGYLERLPDGRFCTIRDFMARTVRSPLPPSAAAWLSRVQGRSVPDAARAADADLLREARGELAGGNGEAG
jgi:hypothetical protein